MPMDLEAATLTELAPRLRRGETSPLEITHLCLDRAKRLNPHLNAYITLTEEQALADAARAEEEIHRGHYRGPLHGIPFSIKDNLATQGVRTTAGSKILHDWIPDHDATVVRRLKEAGAIILGKTNMHEWALGGTTINPFYGTTRNPWNTGHIAGGSSGGSAAAVASGMCLASVGTDSAQSVRNPASMCGVAGLKPTYGRVSQHGTVPGTGAYSTNHTGIIARSAADCALVLQVIAGYDPNDPLSASEPVPNFSGTLGKDVKGIKVGILRGYFDEFIGKEVRASLAEAISALHSLGMHAEDVTTAHLDLIPAIKVCTSRVENAAAHDVYLRTRAQDYSKPTLHSYISALLTPATTYVMAQRARRLVCEEFNALFKRVQLLVLPTIPFAAPTIVDCQSGTIDIDGKKIKRQDARGGVESFCCIPFNVTGLPAISVCCGFSQAGMPIGLQIVAGAFQEPLIFQAAQAYERLTEWYKRKLPLPI
ncbi:MAG TPA: amidase [Terriglobales bacterium]|nr:amidase [Terriglobales bacterium]